MKTRYKSMKPKQKWVDSEFENACRKIQEWLQEEENRKNGKRAQTISFAFTTRYLYRKYLKGKQYGGKPDDNLFF